MTERELEILSEALQMYAVKYSNMRNPKVTLRDEPEEAIQLLKKLNGFR